MPINQPSSTKPSANAFDQPNVTNPSPTVNQSRPRTRFATKSERTITDRHPRRNAPSLRLSEADRDDERSEAFEALARLLRNMMVHSPAGLEQTIADVFPWATFLPKRDRVAFVDELTTTLMAVVGLENYAPVGQLLREWKAPAEIHADPKLARRLRRSIDADGDAVTIPGQPDGET